jgi:hypothetical protein
MPAKPEREIAMISRPGEFRAQFGPALHERPNGLRSANEAKQYLRGLVANAFHARCGLFERDRYFGSLNVDYRADDIVTRNRRYRGDHGQRPEKLHALCNNVGVTIGEQLLKMVPTEEQNVAALIELPLERRCPVLTDSVLRQFVACYGSKLG